MGPPGVPHGCDVLAHTREPSRSVGTRPITVVPRPIALCTFRDPPTASSRSAIPCNPVPYTVAPGSNPTPLSLTSNRRSPLDTDRCTVAEDTSAYFATF